MFLELLLSYLAVVVAGSPGHEMMSVASPRKSITEKVFERVGGVSYLSSYLKSNNGHSHHHHRASQDESDYDYYDDEGTMELVQIGAERTKNVLILMSDTGGGHRASAEAIKDAFRLEFGDEYRVILNLVLNL